MERRGRESIEKDGKTYSCSWRVEKMMITVSSSLGEKTMLLGASPPELLAKYILRELVDEGRATPDATEEGQQES